MKKCSNILEDGPLVSVVLCTYNDEKYIKGAIESILTQTYKNFEFIVWNDGSTDSTEDIVRSFQDGRIRYFYHQNVGLGGALKMACQKANGKYIARMDGDDVCMPDRIQKEVEFLEGNPQYVLVSGQMQYIDEEGKEQDSTFICTTDYIVRNRLPQSSTICHPASMFRKSAYDACGGYIALRFMEDHLFFQRLLHYGRARILPDVLIRYRIRRGSLIQSNTGNKYSDLLNAYREKMVRDENVNEKDISLYNEIYTYSKKEMADVSKIIPPLLRQHKSLQVNVFNTLKPILGDDISRKIIISIKNCIYYIKLKIQVDKLW